MSRNTSVSFREAVNSPETSEVFLVLLELSSDEFSSAVDRIRLTSDSVATISNGEIYQAFPFELALPEDTPDALPTASLTIDNVDRTIIQEIRGITGPINVRMMIVLASDPDTIEIDIPDFKLKHITYNALTISGTLTIDSFLSEPFPGDRFVPSLFPGIF